MYAAAFMRTVNKYSDRQDRKTECPHKGQKGISMLNIKAKNTNAAQFQLEYVMYMMLSSYYKKAKCTSKRSEERLYLYYMDMTKDKQYRLEENCIQCIEEEILPEIGKRIPELSDIVDMECEVRLANRGDHHILSFISPKGSYSLILAERGKKLEYRISA